jgi:CsoR family transcriptional regulator, copper-sensing transcriptional repressor
MITSGGCARSRGQVRGLQKMIDADAWCPDVVIQVASATRALQEVAVGLLTDHLRHCVTQTSIDVSQRRGLTVAEPVKADLAAAIAALHRLGVEVVMITGGRRHHRRGRPARLHRAGRHMQLVQSEPVTTQPEARRWPRRHTRSRG